MRKPTDRSAEILADFAQKRRRAEARFLANSPKKISTIVGRVMNEKGYGRIVSNQQLQAGWNDAAGERFAPHTRLGRLRRGTLEVIVENSLLLQELSFAQDEILRRLQAHEAAQQVRRFRFRTGSIS